MVRNLAAALLGTALLLSSGAALAQQEVIQEPDRVVYQKTTRIEFGTFDVEGKLVMPSIDYAPVGPKAKFSSLIEFRSNFLPEIQKSVDNL